MGEVEGCLTLTVLHHVRQSMPDALRAYHRLRSGLSNAAGLLVTNRIVKAKPESRVIGSCCTFVFRVYFGGLCEDIMAKLENRIAVVTGGASGLGRGIALRLASEGAKVEIIDQQDAGGVVQEIQQQGGEAVCTVADVTDEASIVRAVEGVGQRHGRVDILVNNAGILSPRKPWTTLSRTELERFMQVNFIGYFLVAQAFYPLLKQSQAGRIINVASRTYFLANPGQLAYVASKGAVMGMTRVLAKELGPDNITVNAVAPGMVATPGTQAYSSEEDFNRVMNNQAIKKRGEPRHLAGLVAFLASDDGELITGQLILSDGGGYLI